MGNQFLKWQNKPAKCEDFRLSDGYELRSSSDDSVHDLVMLGGTYTYGRTSTILMVDNNDDNDINGADGGGGVTKIANDL